jgi:predicted dehydrogenase
MVKWRHARVRFNRVDSSHPRTDAMTASHLPSTIGQGRRRFLKFSGAAALGSLAFPSLHAQGANNKVRLGLIGCGDRGGQLLKEFDKVPDITFVAFSDPDQERLDRLSKGRGDVGKFQDYRKLLEQKDVDAVVIASPNFWHALHTIHACEAGKDVYVEKPVTFSLDQGAPMLEAAKRNRRIVQAGTQNRSDVGLIPAFEMIRSGKIGRITEIRGLCYRNRNSIGKLDAPLKPPATLDYNLWLGGAKDQPIMRPKLHYDWHWDYNTGNGDVGNQAPHEFDLISWVLGDPEFTGELRSFGNRFAWDDAGNTANIHTVWYEMAGVPVIFEVNNLGLSPQRNVEIRYRSRTVGVIITCEGGVFLGGRGGGVIESPDGKTRLHRFAGDAGGNHPANFINAVRSRREQDLAAPLEKSIKSAALSHYANLSYRTGRPAADLRAQVPAPLVEVLERQAPQLEAWGVDTKAKPYILGSTITAGPGASITAPPEAQALRTPEYREPFGMPAPKA